VTSFRLESLCLSCVWGGIARAEEDKEEIERKKKKKKKIIYFDGWVEYHFCTAENSSSRLECTGKSVSMDRES